jgi:hypothetical protein
MLSVAVSSQAWARSCFTVILGCQSSGRRWVPPVGLREALGPSPPQVQTTRPAKAFGDASVPTHNRLA